VRGLGVIFKFKFDYMQQKQSRAILRRVVEQKKKPVICEAKLPEK
jgi:hypothetical protein